MLDIRLIRENPGLVRERLATRGGDAHLQIDTILGIDTERRKLETRVQQLNADRKRISKEIGNLRTKGGLPASSVEFVELERRSRQTSEEIEGIEVKLNFLEQQQRILLLQLPNLPHDNAIVGCDASQNPVVKTWGEKPALTNPLDHIELGKRLGLFDLDRAAKISGSGFVCFTGAGARLERALINFCLDLHTCDHGYTELSPPFIVRRDALTGTGQLPKFEDQLYAIPSEDMFLVPTAEVPLTNLHRDEILSASDLPKKYVAYTPCFRSEAGAAGVGTRGMIRVHQFDKVELVKITTPEHSFAELESLTADAERVLQLLGLHYRVIELCTGDLGFGSAKTYDIEVWAPGQNAYLEVSSCSNFTDFQARRMNLKYKNADGKNVFCHTLNGSGTAMPRLFVALIENYQQPDGSVKIPAPLQPALGAGPLAMTGARQSA